MDWPFVTTLIDRDEVASTSDLARDLVAAGVVPLPLAVRARRQTRGRGRGTNAWWSDEGSLTFTLALDPATHLLRPWHEPRLALAVAVGIVDAVVAIAATRAPLGIRWPNDVEAGGKKLAGILPERVDTGAGPRLLIGIGVNVAARLDAAPPTVREMATTVHAICLGDVPRPAPDALLWAFLERLAPLVARLAADDPALAERWASLDTLIGRPVRVKLPGRVLEGFGRGIDAEGALLVATRSGVERLFGGQVLREG
jgi:BirA family transcriptional regulator, biotin operon repressor / biotin---[acetyl-CoA-carboxylase] ligase